eukprot:1158079-Pelagomonas_calceolata.AAC.12
MVKGRKLTGPWYMNMVLPPSFTFEHENQRAAPTEGVQTDDSLPKHWQAGSSEFLPMQAKNLCEPKLTMTGGATVAGCTICWCDVSMGVAGMLAGGAAGSRMAVTVAGCTMG